MGIKKIKKENESVNISLVDLMGKLDASSTKKYTQFLVKILKKSFDNDMKYLIKDSSHRENKLQEVLDLKTFDGWLTQRLIGHLYGYDEMILFIDFCNFMERGLTNEKDISKYDSWDMVSSEVYMAKNRDLFKKAKKEVKVVYEDDQFFCIKPLTYEASVSYGYQTKWCTASVHEQSYFYNHSRDGVLVYVIDKLNNEKFGFYHNNHQLQIYNQKDDRVDSMETGLPLDLLHKLFGEMKSDANDKNFNYKLFGDIELKKMEKYRNGNTAYEITVPMEGMMVEQEVGREEPIPEPVMEGAIINYAQERTNDLDIIQDDGLEYLRQRLHTLRPRNPIEVGDDLPI